jgi:hypothetical protein
VRDLTQQGRFTTTTFHHQEKIMRKKTAANSANNEDAISTELRMIPLVELIPSPNNTRGQIDEGSLTGLVASIRKRGVLQAILVREIATLKAGKAKYQIVAGERRFRAAKLAGLKEIPAQIKSMTDEEALGDQIVELFIGMAVISLSINDFTSFAWQ